MAKIISIVLLFICTVSFISGCQDSGGTRVLTPDPNNSTPPRDDP